MAFLKHPFIANGILGKIGSFDFGHDSLQTCSMMTQRGLFVDDVASAKMYDE